MLQQHKENKRCARGRGTLEGWRGAVNAHNGPAQRRRKISDGGILVVKAGQILQSVVLGHPVLARRTKTRRVGWMNEGMPFRWFAQPSKKWKGGDRLRLRSRGGKGGTKGTTATSPSPETTPFLYSQRPPASVVTKLCHGLRAGNTRHIKRSQRQREKSSRPTRPGPSARQCSKQQDPEWSCVPVWSRRGRVQL